MKKMYGSVSQLSQAQTASPKEAASITATLRMFASPKEAATVSCEASPGTETLPANKQGYGRTPKVMILTHLTPGGSTIQTPLDSVATPSPIGLMSHTGFAQTASPKEAASSTAPR
jgi:hypothetical protein